jgi:hypothetical protein
MSGSSDKEYPMAPDDDWPIEPNRPGVLSRLINPQAGAKPATTAFVLGIGAAVAFVASLVLQWQRVTFTVPRDADFSVRTGAEVTSVANPGTVDMLGEVYLLGMVALLGLVGAVLARPDLALRLRMAVTGIGVGLLGIVIAVVLRFPESAAGVYDGFFGVQGIQDELRASAKVAYEPGVAAAAVAVALAVAAVWLAARPAVRALTPTQDPPAQPYAVVPPHAAAPRATAPRQPGRLVHVDELSVSPSEPADITVTPDPWSR